MSWVASLPSGEGRSVDLVAIVVVFVSGGSDGGGVVSLLEWPRDKSLKR